MPTINGRACVVNGAPVDKVYSNGKQVYGRNYVLNSSGMNASMTTRPAMQSGGTGSNAYGVTVAYNSDSITLIYGGNGTGEWYYALVEAWQSYASGNLDKAKQYTISVDVKGTVPRALFRISDVVSPSVAINSSTWTRLTYTFTLASLNANRYYIRLNAAGTSGTSMSSEFTNGQTLSFRNFKLEAGSVATPWTPAPEDVGVK